MITIGPFRALAHTFTIASEDETIAGTLDAVFRPLTATEGADTGTTYTVRRTEDGWFTAHAGDTLVASVDDADVVIEHLVWVINRSAVDSWDGTLLHGGAVQSPDGAGVVVVGRSGHGKSTLVTQLVRTGFGYLSDELVPIMPDGSVQAHPRSIGLKAGSWSLVDDVVTTAVTRDGEGQRHVDPAELAARIVDVTHVDLVVILDRAPVDGDPLEIEEIGTARAVYELTHHAFALSEFEQADLERIRAMTGTGRTVVMSGGTPPERATAIERLVNSA